MKPVEYPNKCPQCQSSAIKRRMLIHKSGSSASVRRNIFSGLSIGLSGRTSPRFFIGSSGGKGTKTSLLAAQAAPASIRPALRIIFFSAVLCIASPWFLIGALWGVICLIFAIIDKQNYHKEWWCPKCGGIFTLNKVYLDDPNDEVLDKFQTTLPLTASEKDITQENDEEDSPAPDFEKIEKGLRKYCAIQESFWEVNVVTNREFQKRFNGFYRIRNNSEWQSHFYELMERSKTEDIGFEKALRTMWEKTGRVEASFCSKLVATRHNNQPIIDKHVLNNLGLSLPTTAQADRLSKVVDIYQALEKKYDNMLQDPILISQIDQFKEKFPDTNISDVKSLDFILWQTR